MASEKLLKDIRMPILASLATLSASCSLPPARIEDMCHPTLSVEQQAENLFLHVWGPRDFTRGFRRVPERSELADTISREECSQAVLNRAKETYGQNTVFVGAVEAAEGELNAHPEYYELVYRWNLPRASEEIN